MIAKLVSGTFPTKLLIISMLTALVVFTTAACSPASDGSGDAPESEEAAEETVEPDLPAMAIVGPEEMVFDWTTDQCAEDDIPDLPARAFRDGEGLVHLVSAHPLTRDNVGHDLNSIVHTCDVLLTSDKEDDPSQHNDNEWIAALYTEDGQTIYASIHNEYHGWEHDNCDGTETVFFGCWYNTLTLAVSTDGGKSFNDVNAAPDHFVAGLPLPYEVREVAYGIMEPSNIVKGKDGYFYQFVKYQTDSVRQEDSQYACLMRTNDLSDPRSWRAWDGSEFTIQFIDPYTNPDANPSEHTCAKMQQNNIGNMTQSLTYNTYLDKYVLFGISADFLGREVWGIYYSFSDDLINWTHRQLLWEVELTWTYHAGDDKPIGYPTLIDPDSPSLSFDVVGKQAYLYFTKYNLSHPLDRDLVRVPVEFFISEVEALAADTRTQISLETAEISSNSVAVSGMLTNAGGAPLAGKSVEIAVIENEGEGGYSDYVIEGTVPENANRALIGYRINTECECDGSASEFFLYDYEYVEGLNSENVVIQYNFAGGAGLAAFWDGPQWVEMLSSDRDDTLMVHLSLPEGSTARGNFAEFGVNSGEPYSMKFGARVPASSENTGYFMIIFMNVQEGLLRVTANFEPRAIPIGVAVTDAEGKFEFIWESPTNNSVIVVTFFEDQPYLGSEETIDLFLP